MKKLIYYTLGNNKEYIQITKLHLLSLFNQNYDGDILFITNYKEELTKTIEFIKEPHFLDFGNSDLFSSSANKLKIHKFEKINEYEKIIFCDLDTLWLQSPDSIFDKITSDNFYVTNETPLMSKDMWWGGNFFSLEEKIDIESNNIKGINAGFFAFNNNMIKYFEEIENFFNENISMSSYCLEQPFLNVFLYRKKLYSTELNYLISHEGCLLKKYDGVLLHFAGGPGQSGNKLSKMNIFYENNIK